MYDVVMFAALGWEARAVVAGLAAPEAAGQPGAWRGHLGDGASALVVATGIGPARAARAVASAPAGRLLATVGCAGALVASLRAGDLVLANALVPLDGAGRPGAPVPVGGEAVATWAIRRGLALRVGPIASSACVLESPAGKAVAAAAGALVVEMESGPIAAAARARGVPFVGLRVVLDEADQAVPLGVLAVDGQGEVRPLRAAAALALRPRLIPALARLARQRRLAERRLRDGIGLLLGGGLDAFGIAPRGAGVAAG